MKCPYCGYDKIQPNFNICPICRTSKDEVQANNFLMETYTHTVVCEKCGWNIKPHIFHDFKCPSCGQVNEPNYNIVWKLRDNEVARCIDLKEFASIPNTKGVFVPEGVSVALVINGNVEAILTNGDYDFAEEINNATEYSQSVWKFFAASKKETKSQVDVHCSPEGHRRWRESVDAEILAVSYDNMKRKSHLKTIIDNIDDSSSVNVVLLSDNFSTYRVQLSNISISIKLEIIDFAKFISYYLPIGIMYRMGLNMIINPICTIIQNKLAEDHLEPKLSMATKEEILHNVNSNLYGINVTDISFV